MKQRYDLLAFALLTFSVIFTVWMAVLPVNWEGIKAWQTLISATVAGVAIVVASFNVARQMRLTMRNREHDRIEKELPGLRAAHNLVDRFKMSAHKVVTSFPANETKPDTKGILTEFRGIGALTAEFDAAVEKALPSTHDTARRELSIVLRALRDPAQRLDDLEEAMASNKKAIKGLESMPPGSVPGDDSRRLRVIVLQEELGRQKPERDTLLHQLNVGIAELDKYCERLAARIAHEEQMGEILRRKQREVLGGKS